MDRREIFKIANLKEIQKEFNLPKLFCFDYCVGYDQCVYLLLSRQPQRREYPNIMHFKKKEYYAIKLKMDWEKQKVTEKEKYSLGIMPYEWEFLRPLNDCFLLIGDEKKKINEEIIYEDDVLILSKESCCQKEDIILDLDEDRKKKTGILLDKDGVVVKKYEFKKDIFDCQTSEDGQIFIEEEGEENKAVSENREKVMISINNYRWARYWEGGYDENKNLLTDEKLVQMEYQGKYVKNVANKVYGSKMLFWVDDETIGGHFFKENNRIEVIDPEENREVFPIVDLEDLKKNYQIEEYDISDYYVGYDKKIYMLFCNKWSTVHKGKSYKPSDYREYIAVTLELDWIKGRVVDTQIFSLGRQDYHFYAIRPLKENFLLLGWKTKGKRGNKNGVLMNKNGEILRKYYFGTEIGKCCTTKDGIIYTGCDDYALYDDINNLDDIRADMSVNAWNEQGKKIAKVGKNMCEAVNLADDGMFWHYDEYERLIGTDLKRTVTIWVNDFINLLDRLEKTIDRINQSQSTGLWKFSTYVLGYDATTSKSVANYLKGITQGKESYIEPTVVQEWSRVDGQPSCAFTEIKKYISLFSHPVFMTANEQQNDVMMVTATSYVGTDELSNVIAFPKKSLQGIPVVSGVSFGREPYSLNPLKKDLEILCYFCGTANSKNRYFK